MEHYFRLALMLFLVGLPCGAVPIAVRSTRCITLTNLDLDQIQDKVTCDANKTFTCPTNMTCSDAMKCFIKQLENATETGCKDEDNHILSTLDYLTADNIPDNCMWSTEESQKNLTMLVKDIETLIQKINIDC